MISKMLKTDTYLNFVNRGRIGEVVYKIIEQYDCYGHKNRKM